MNGSIEKETRQVLENVGAVLQGASMSYENVVQCTVFLTDVNDYAQVNDMYGRYFNETPPARRCRWPHFSAARASRFPVLRCGSLSAVQV